MSEESSRTEVPELQREGGTVCLVGTKCPDCEQRAFPGRKYCSNCLAEVVEWVVTSNLTLETYTEIHIAAARFDAPYLAGFVRISSDEILVFAPLVGAKSDLDVGMSLEPTVAEVGDEKTWAFRPSRDGD